MKKIELIAPKDRGDSPANVKKDLRTIEKTINQLIDEVDKLNKSQAVLRSNIQNDVNSKVKELSDKVNRLDKALKYVNRRATQNRDNIDNHSHGLFGFFKKLFKRK